MTRPTMTAAIRHAHTEVTTLRYEGGGYAHSTYTHSTYDHTRRAWIASRSQQYAAAVASRRMALARAALDWACREFGLAMTHDAINQGVWSGRPLREIVTVELRNLVAAG